MSKRRADSDSNSDSSSDSSSDAESVSLENIFCKCRFSILYFFRLKLYIFMISYISELLE